MITKRRYRVGIDVRAYTRKFIMGCCISSLITMIIMLIGFALLCGPGIKTLIDNHVTEIAMMGQSHSEEIERLNSEWEQKMNAQRMTYETQYKQDTSLLDDRIHTLEADLSAAQLTLGRIEASSEEDFDLLRKYWYVFQRAGDNSGLSIDVIRHVEEVCEKWDVNPHWMWAVYWEESNFRAKIDNTSGSGARGLGQVMPSTGKSYWENVLGNGAGSFKTDMLYDPYVNVDITVAIIGRNLSNGQTMYQVLNQYSGGGGKVYFNEVVANGKTHGITLDDSNWHYPYK